MLIFFSLLPDIEDPWGVTSHGLYHWGGTFQTAHQNVQAKMLSCILFGTLFFKVFSFPLHSRPDVRWVKRAPIISTNLLVSLINMSEVQTEKLTVSSTSLSPSESMVIKRLLSLFDFHTYHPVLVHTFNSSYLDQWYLLLTSPHLKAPTSPKHDTHFCSHMQKPQQFDPQNQYFQAYPKTTVFSFPPLAFTL